MLLVGKQIKVTLHGVVFCVVTCGELSQGVVQIHDSLHMMAHDARLQFILKCIMGLYL